MAVVAAAVGCCCCGGCGGCCWLLLLWCHPHLFWGRLGWIGASLIYLWVFWGDSGVVVPASFIPHLLKQGYQATEVVSKQDYDGMVPASIIFIFGIFERDYGASLNYYFWGAVAWCGASLIYFEMMVAASIIFVYFGENVLGLWFFSSC